MKINQFLRIAALGFAFLVSININADAQRINSAPPKTMGFNKIWVSGKVKLILVQGQEEGVRGLLNYNPEMTSVQQQGQTLIINTMEREYVTLEITLKELHRIEAYGESTVTTVKNFNTKNLQLFLSQSAVAKIKTKADHIYTVVSDDAVLKVSGDVGRSTLYGVKRRNVNFNNLASLHSEHFITDKLNADQIAFSSK